MSVALPKGNVAHYLNAISAAAIYIALPRLGASQHATGCAGCRAMLVMYAISPAPGRLPIRT